MKNEKRFKVGDKVTYKDIKGCVNSNGTKGWYYNGGDDQGGYVGRIVRYSAYNEDMGCWLITVTTKGSLYHMLESEFLEYDKPVVSELFPIY